MPVGSSTIALLISTASLVPWIASSHVFLAYTRADMIRIILRDAQRSLCAKAGIQRDQAPIRPLCNSGPATSRYW